MIWRSFTNCPVLSPSHRLWVLRNSQQCGRSGLTLPYSPDEFATYNNTSDELSYDFGNQSNLWETCVYYYIICREEVDGVDLCSSRCKMFGWFIWLLNRFSSRLRPHCLLCSFFDCQDVAFFGYFFYINSVDIQRRLAIGSTLLSGYSSVLIQEGDISSLLMAVDVSCYVRRMYTVRFVLRFGKLTKDFESQVTTIKSFAVVSDHHVNLWG